MLIFPVFLVSIISACGSGSETTSGSGSNGSASLVVVNDVPRPELLSTGRGPFHSISSVRVKRTGDTNFGPNLLKKQSSNGVVIASKIIMPGGDKSEIINNVPVGNITIRTDWKTDIIQYIPDYIDANTTMSPKVASRLDTTYSSFNIQNDVRIELNRITNINYEDTNLSPTVTYSAATSTINGGSGTTSCSAASNNNPWMAGCNNGGMAACYCAAAYVKKACGDYSYSTEVSNAAALGTSCGL